jgi:hypothetical protein
VAVAAVATTPPLLQHANSTFDVSPTVTALTVSVAFWSTNEARREEGLTRLLLADGLVHGEEDGWR